MRKNNKSWITIDGSNHVHLRARRNKASYSLYLDIRHKGKRIYEALHLSISTTDKRKMSQNDKAAITIAKKVMSERILQIMNNEYNVTTHEDKDYLLYFEQFTNNKVEANTLDKFKWVGANKHLHIFTNNQPVLFKDVNFAFLEDLKVYLLDNLAINTASSYFSLYNQVFKNALREGIINSNPMDMLYKKINSKQSKREYLTFEELQKLDATECQNEETKRAFLFCCFTGLRFSDVRALLWEHIRYEGKKTIMYINQIKTDEVLMIPLSESALKYLGKRNDNNKNVFSLYTSTPVRKQLVKWAEMAGIDKHVTFHVARHTFATLALNFGVDIKVVSKLLGHNAVRTTEIYAKIMDKTKEEAVKKLPKL